MTTITTAPQVSWAAAHRMLLLVIGALVAIAAGAAVALLLMSGSTAPAVPATDDVRFPAAVDEPGCNVVRGPC